jgi:hypothetical protein
MQPQYAYQTAPMNMPSMAHGGLAALPVKRFQKGGLSDTAVGGLFSPIAEVGPFSVTPANVIGMVAPPAVGVPLGLLGAYNSFMAKQEPAPIMEAKTAAEVEAQQAQMDADIAAAQDAEDAAQGLAMMNQMQAQQEQEVSPADVAADVASVVAATQDAVDADAGATAAANAAAAGDGGGGGGGSSDGGGPGDAGPGSDGSATGGADSSDAGGAGAAFQYGGQVMNYEQGGVAAARQAQSKGRGQDTMLVHMTPGEVKGLQALAMSQGGSLTINPQTGLPEAGFLSSILPMIAGMALAPLTAGTSLAFLGATPFASALTVGGLTGLATGSLKKGLMAGLGAYGGAGIGQGMSAAAGTAENLAAAAPTTPAPGSFGQIGQSNLATLPTSAPTPPFASPTMGSPFQTPGVNLGAADLGNLANIPPPAPTGLDAFTGGTKAMLQTGTPGEVARSAFMKAAPTGSLMAAGTTLASALTPEPAPLPTSKSFIRPFDLSISNPSGTPMYTPQDTREREQVRYTYSPREIYQAAQGGLTALNGQTYDDEYGRDEYKAGGQAKARSKSLKGEPYYKFADSRRDSSMEAAVDQNFAKGGLGSVLPPRFLSGGGDGMSDSIKANIDGKQEARLADGEFVVPADVVSHLGNGSSKAGAKKLYAMMDKIRKARTGSKRQAPEVNAQRYMPA